MKRKWRHFIYWIKSGWYQEPTGEWVCPPADCRKMVQKKWPNHFEHSVWHDPRICDGSCGYGDKFGFIKE